MRGYDAVEVDTFLDMIGNEFEKLFHETKEYDKKIIVLETELNNFKEVESTLKQTLMNVQENSDKSLANSRKEADLIKKESELEAQKLIESARRERDKMKGEVATLQAQKQSLISRLRHVLSSQLELMDVLELDDVDISKLKDRTKKVFSAAKPVEKTPISSKIEKKSQIQRKDEERTAEEKNDTEGSNLFKDVFGDEMDTFVK